MANSYSYILPGNPPDVFEGEGISMTEESKSWQFILILAFLSILFSALLTPDKPHQLASICQKYNTASACQVW